MNVHCVLYCSGDKTRTWQQPEGGCILQCNRFCTILAVAWDDQPVTIEIDFVDEHINQRPLLGHIRHLYRKCLIFSAVSFAADS